MAPGLSFFSQAEAFHYIAGGVLLPALLIRLYLLFFGKGTERLSDCEPNMHRLAQSWQVLRYYLTLGKAPLPKWYSHNPLWGPLYLLLFFCLFLAVASGILLLNGVFLITSVSLIDLHRVCHVITSVFILLHIPAVFFHDLSNQASDISGMINGYRIFDTVTRQHSGKPSGQFISIESLSKRLKK